MREIKRFIQIDDAQNIEQVYSTVTEYIETYHGHVVSGLWEAEEWLRGEDDTRDAKYGESVQAVMTTAEDGEIYVRVTEIYLDGGDSDYCYTVDVDCLTF